MTAQINARRKTPPNLNRENGVIAIFISVLMLVMISLLVMTAYNSSTINLRAAGNVQVREQAAAAAQNIIEETMSGTFTLLTTEVLDQPVDINNDGAADFFVDLSVPRCIQAIPEISGGASSVSLPGFTTVAWNTVWELEATATEISTGASVRVVQGVRKFLTDAQKTARCN